MKIIFFYLYNLLIFNVLKNVKKMRGSYINALFAKYEYLAVEYARKIKLPIHSFFEKGDVEQELRIRLYGAIQTYSLKYVEWLKTGKYEPTPLEYYLKTSMNHKIADIANNMFSKKENNPAYKMSIENENFDVGVMNNDANFVNGTDFYINGCNVFESLPTEVERNIFMLFLHGFKKKEICQKLQCDAFIVANTIDKQIMYIRENMKDIFEQQNNKLYYTFEMAEN